jgi:hypothetical protein
METVELSRASAGFCTAVQDLLPRPVEAVKSGLHLALPIRSPLRITDERIGDEPECWWKLAGTLEPDLWIWNPDLLQAGSLIPVYRLQGARS